MGNRITYHRRPDLGDVDMSNGLTSVLIATLSLALSALAETDRQRELAVWFASHDQGVLGVGTIGFDVGEVPWRVETFEEDRAFLLAAIRAATARTGWDRLGYTPREDWTVACLEHLGRLIESFDVGDRDEDAGASWGVGDRPDAFELCPEHAIYVHFAGCVLCNDR